jgi:hypothetical protein
VSWASPKNTGQTCCLPKVRRRVQVALLRCIRHGGQLFLITPPCKVRQGGSDRRCGVPELVLIEIATADVAEAQRRLRAGEDPFEIVAPLWADHFDLACLVCDSKITGRPFTVIVPSRDRGKMIAAPLCETCSALPPALRAHRAEKMLRQMWSKRGGPQIHFR